MGGGGGGGKYLPGKKKGRAMKFSRKNNEKFPSPTPQLKTYLPLYNLNLIHPDFHIN